MFIPKERFARDMNLVKAMRMGLDESLIAMREAFADLGDEDFQRFALPGRMNIATLVMHCLQQVDSYNANLQARRGVRGPVNEWLFRAPEERFGLYGLPPEKLPKPGQPFPSVAEAVEYLDPLHRAVILNMTEMPEEAFREELPHWPRLSDPFFRAIYHLNAHIRQIWFMRGTMGIDSAWPTQHYA